MRGGDASMDGSGTSQTTRSSEGLRATGRRAREPVRLRAARVAIVLAAAALIALAGIVLNKHDIALVDTLDKHVGDWRIALGSPRAKEQRSDIAIVLVTEETLLDYESRSPIDRLLLAELVRALDAAGARVIALDFIFDRRTRHDQTLLAALRESRAPVVLGAFDERIAAPVDSFAMQAAFMQAAGRPFGHVLLERKVGVMAGANNTVRLVAPPHEPPGGSGGGAANAGRRATAPPAAFSEEIARAAGVTPRGQTRVISWLRPPSSSEPLFVTLEVPRHAEGSLKPAMQGLLPASWREFVKGRIVLVGASMIDRDLHGTPLTVMEGGPTHGVYIQAQALAQILDGDRDIQVWPVWVTFLVTALIALLCLLAASVQGFNPRGSLYGILGLGLIGLASFIAFWLWRVDFPSIALATAWAAGGIVGFFSRWFFRRLGV